MAFIPPALLLAALHGILATAFATALNAAKGFANFVIFIIQSMWKIFLRVALAIWKLGLGLFLVAYLFSAAVQFVFVVGFTLIAGLGIINPGHRDLAIYILNTFAVDFFIAGAMITAFFRFLIARAYIPLT